MNARTWGWAGLAVLVLAGCGSDASLQTRPADRDSAEELAELVAEEGDCGSLEYFNDEEGIWTFTCQADDRSFTIYAVTDAEARAAVVDGSAGFLPMKGGDFFLIQEARYEDGPRNVLETLDRFPGEPVS